MAGGYHLSDGAPAVIADQDNAMQVEGLEKVCHQTANAGRGQVGVRAHRARMGTEGQLGGKAAEFASQKLDHGIPEVGTHQVAVEENKRDAAASLVIVQSAMSEVNCGHVLTSKI